MLTRLRRSYLGRIVAHAAARHPGAAEGQRLRLLGSIVIPAMVGALASRLVSESAVPDVLLVLGLGFLGAAIFNAFVFLWNAALAPSRMQRESAVLHAEVVRSMQAELDRGRAPLSGGK